MPFALDLFSVLLHELGHSLGLLHIFGEPAVMSGDFLRIFPLHEEADLFPADIRELHALYGAGTGSVHPLPLNTAPIPEPGTIVLVASGLGLTLCRRRLRRVPFCRR